MVTSEVGMLSFAAMFAPSFPIIKLKYGQGTQTFELFLLEMWCMCRNIRFGF